MNDLVEVLRSKSAHDPALRALLKSIDSGKANFRDTARYSIRYSHQLGNILSENVLDIPPDVRETAAEELLKYGYDDMNTILAEVQKSLDEQAGIHIRPQKADFPSERVQQFAHSLIDPTVEDSIIKRRARSGSETITKSFHDSFIKKNAQFRNDAGLKCYITREGSNCCKWCSEVAGRYEFGSQPSDIFRRHDNCDCTIDYDGQKLRGKLNADGSRSKTWEEVPDADGSYEPKVLSVTDARAAEQRNLSQFRGLTNGTNGGKIKSRGVKPMTISSIDSPIEQRHNGKGNPNAINIFGAELNNRQKQILEQLPDFDSSVIVPKDSVNMADLAALTAETGHEFAMFTKNANRLIIRGNTNMVNIDVEKAKQLAKEGYRWSGHTHPGVNFNCLTASPGDKSILRCFPQNTSVIYNSKGQYLTFDKEE